MAKSNTPGRDLRRWLDVLSGTHADLALQLVVDLSFAATLESSVLYVNLTKNSAELNGRKEIGVAPQLFWSAFMR